LSEKQVIKVMLQNLNRQVQEMKNAVPKLNTFSKIDLMVKESGYENLLPQEIINEGVETEKQLQTLLWKLAECYQKLSDAIKHAVLSLGEGG